MWSASSDNEAPKKLRSGLTTGSCATACCVAAATVLFYKSNLTSNQTSKPITVTITLPKGKDVEMPIQAFQTLSDNAVRVSTIKDAGDDPDVTHGATVFVELRLVKETGIQLHAGEGVGTVTREGLSLAVGEPAINPVPRQMITEHLEKIARLNDYHGGFDVTVGVENGQALALKTMNPRLGILGGLSILGTTGIVRPFSCAAYIASIQQGIDVASTNGITHITATTGNRSETAMQQHYGFDDMAMIEMGDFIGAVLKHIKNLNKQNTLNLKKISICGGFGKITKFANGFMDLHSAKSKIDLSKLADLAALQGADQGLQHQITKANTSIEALKLCQSQSIELANAVCEQALTVAQSKLPDSIEVEIFVIDRVGKIVGQAHEK